MPFTYFAPCLLLVVAAASVAAGRLGDLWALALAGGLLVHGHAEFLFLVPLLAGAALLVMYLRSTDRRAIFGQHRRAWARFGGIIALFLLPIVLDLVLHFPGEFGKYLSYGSSGHGSGRTPLGIVEYVLQFWPGDGRTGVGLLLLVGLFAAVPVLARLLRDRAARSYLLIGTAAVVYLTLAFTVYVAVGVDNLTEAYIGEFSRAAPLALMMVIAAAAGAILDERITGRSPARALRLGAAVALAGVVLVVQAQPSLVTYREHVDGVPETVAALADHTDGRPAIMDFENIRSWPQGISVVLGGERRGVRVCMGAPNWRVLVSEPFLCTAEELRVGTVFTVRAAGPQPDNRVVLSRLGEDLVVTADR
jgi:hypothetical protein